MISVVEHETLLDEENIAADDDGADVPTPQWQIDEVRRRIAEYEKNPVGGVSWEELKTRILSKSCPRR